jgi:hypothetical protein
MRKVILVLAFVTALFTAVNSAVANGPMPECGEDCPWVQ